MIEIFMKKDSQRPHIAPPDNHLLLEEILCLSSSINLGSIAKHFWILMLIRRWSSSKYNQIDLRRY